MNLFFSDRDGLMGKDKNTGSSVLCRMEVRRRYQIDLHYYLIPSFD